MHIRINLNIRRIYLSLIVFLIKHASFKGASKHLDAF